MLIQFSMNLIKQIVNTHSFKNFFLNILFFIVSYTSLLYFLTKKIKTSIFTEFFYRFSKWFWFIKNQNIIKLSLSNK